MTPTELAVQTVGMLHVAYGASNFIDFPNLNTAKTILTVIESLAKTVPIIKECLTLFKKKPKVFESSLIKLLTTEFESNSAFRSEVTNLLKDVEPSVKEYISTNIINSSGVAFAVNQSKATVNMKKERGSQK